MATVKIMAKIGMWDDIFETRYLERTTNDQACLDGIFKIAELVDYSIRKTLHKSLRRHTISYYIRDASCGSTNFVYNLLSSYDAWNSSSFFREHKYEINLMSTYQAIPGTFEKAPISKEKPVARKPKKTKDL